VLFLPILLTNHFWQCIRPYLNLAILWKVWKNVIPNGWNDKICKSLVSFYAAREDCCLSNERLHKENVCLPLNEGCHEDLTEFKSHVMSFTDTKMLLYRRGFAGRKLWHKYCLYIEVHIMVYHGAGILSICIQGPCQLSLWTGSRLCHRGRKTNRQAGITESGLEREKSHPLARPACSPYFIFSWPSRACSQMVPTLLDYSIQEPPGYRLKLLVSWMGHHFYLGQ